MSHAHRKKRSPTYILIGDGFDELEVVLFLHKFRQAGLSIKCVSLFDPLVYSRQGVALKADCSLADGPFDFYNEGLLILPAGGRNGEVLRHDARVKSLLHCLDQTNIDVAVTDSDSHLAIDVGQLMGRPTYQPQNNQNLDDFAELLTTHVAC